MGYPAPQQAPPPQTQWQPPAAGATLAGAPALGPPPKKTGLIIAVVAVVVVIVVVAVILVAVLLLGGTVIKTLTPTEFNSELTSWASSQGQFPNLSPGDTVRVSGVITSISTFPPPLTGSLVGLGGIPLLFPVTLPSGCAQGDTMSFTLHVTTLSAGGQNVEWIQEWGSAYGASPSIPTSAISCAGGSTPPPTIQMGPAEYTAPGTFTVSLAGVDRTVAMSSFQVIVQNMTSGVPSIMIAATTIADATLGSSGGVTLAYEDLSADGNFNQGDFFILTGVANNNEYRILIVWKQTGNLITSRDVQG